MEKFRTMFSLANSAVASVSPEQHFDFHSEKKERKKNPAKVSKKVSSKATKTSTDN